MIVPGHYIVVLEDSIDHPGTVAHAQLERHGGKLGLIYRHALKGYSATLPKQAVDALRQNPDVRYIVPDRKVEVASQWIPTGVNRIYAPQNPGAAIDGEDNPRVNADVAVIDTGIDYTHPDLNVAERTNCVPAAETEAFESCVAESGTDGNGHGTHVAGTIGALDNGEGVVGVAPGARLWAVKVLTDAGWGYESWIIGGVDWVTAHSSEIEVANMSLGCECSMPALDTSINKSVEAGVVYAVAAGNGHVDASKQAPASSPDVITVSALADYDGKAGGEAPAECAGYDYSEVGSDDELASFSNFGKDVEVAAPGVCILSTYKEGKYAYISGTSMASPHVAGAAALLAAQSNPNSKADVEAIRGRIVEGGNSEWTDTSPDGEKEPLLDLRRVVTEAPTIESESKVTLRGRVNPEGLATSYRFEYGTTTEYGKSIPVPDEGIGSGTKYASVSQPLEGLQGQTGYHYRLVASNEEEIFHGLDRTFITTPPTVSTEPATEVNANDAKLNATVNPEGAATTYRFEFGPTTSYVGHTAKLQLEAGTEAVEVPPELVDGLDGEATYHFRIVATSLAGTTYGEDETLTTQPADWVTQAKPEPHPEAEEEEGVTSVGRALEGVSCASAVDCVAVGGTRIYHGESMARYNEGFHWDGQTWTATELPLPEDIDASEVTMRGVSCPLPNSCFALGAEVVNPGSGREAFVEHWDGKEWSAQLLPPREEEVEQPSEEEIIYPVGISCASTSSCMAVAAYVGSISGKSAAIFVWDGEEWSHIPPPMSSGGPITAPPSCTSPNACMVIGSGGSLKGGWAAIWDGESWGVEAIPRPAEASKSETVRYDGVSCLSTTSCMAVGQRFDQSTWSKDGSYWPTRRISAYWDGEEWTPVSTAEPEAVNEKISIPAEPVSCTAASDCVMVTATRKDNRWRMLAEHWDGEKWSIQSGANPLWPDTRPQAVSCVQSRCTAVGSIYYPQLLPGYDGDGMFAARLRSAPVATTEPATDVGAKAATLNAKVNPEGYDTTYQFEYVDQEEFEGHGYENATGVPASPKAIGSGTSIVTVGQGIAGLEPGLTYHFRIKATNSTATTYGEDETLRTKRESAGPFLEPPSGTFPASFSLAGEPTVWLRGQKKTIKCTTESGVGALSGEGQFESASAGTATLTLHHCKETSLYTNCNTAGQATGTIKTEALPFRLVYLSDGEPGVLFLPNAKSGQLMAVNCTGGLVKITVSGSGVLGHITDPALGEASSTLTVDFNSPKAEGGGYVQEYTETEAGLKYGLEESVQGSKAESAALEAEPTAAFSEGEVRLVALHPALEPPGGSFPASFSLAGEQEVSLHGQKPVSCKTESGVQALGGEGQFEGASAGTATLTLHNCKETVLHSTCTSSGQAAGTIKTEALPFRLVYLSDGEPGVLFLPNAKNGLLATASCTGGLLLVKVAGSGVLGHVTKPALGEASSTLTVDLNAPEAGKGEYAQEYTETEGGLKYGLQESVQGGESKPASLEAEAVASFSGGEGELTEK